MQKADVVFDALQSLGKKHMPLLRAFRLLFNPCIYLPHNEHELTPLIQALRSQRFRWGQDSAHDNLVQTALVQILTQYLSGRDGPFIHGLRAGTGIHSALRAARAIAQDTQWLGVWHLRDQPALQPNRVKGLFSNTVKDARFQDLLAHFLEFQPNPVETPQRLLTQSWLPSNLHGIFQHLALWELDLHLAELASATGPSAMTDSGKVRPSLRFVRYMNWVLVAGNGSKEESLRWSREINTLVRYSSDAPTGRLAGLQPVDQIPKPVSFLGYELIVKNSGNVLLRISDSDASKMRRPFMEFGKPASRRERTQLTDSEICELFAQEFGAFEQFYALAENRKLLSGVQETLRSSMWRTLAHKHKCRVSMVARNESLRHKGYSLIRRVDKTQFQVNRIDDVCWNDPKQKLVGEPCAMKVACTVRREA